MTRKDDKGDQPSGGETTWTNTGATRYGSIGDDMLRPSPNHGTQRPPNDDEYYLKCNYSDINVIKLFTRNQYRVSNPNQVSMDIT